MTGSDAETETRRETELERIDRNLTELMAELRVAIPGVQVLFAFLLILPFNARFESATSFQEIVYVLTLLATALSTVLLIAPALHHRLQFRVGAKPRILEHSQRLALAGLTLLALAMTGAVVLVCDFVFGAAVATGGAAVVALAFAATWYVLPLTGSGSR